MWTVENQLNSVTMAVCCGRLQRDGLTVEKLLNRFVTLESVDDVACVKCQRSASFVKKLTVGKVC